MFKINRKMEYALIVLKHFQNSHGNDVLTVRSICDLYNIPFDTTSKVMQVMNSEHILESIQGVNGGYRIAVDLNKINFLQLSELIEKRKLTQGCESSNCSLIETCNIITPIKKLNEYLKYFFKTLSIKELLDDSLGPQSLIFNTTTRNTK